MDSIRVPHTEKLSDVPGDPSQASKPLPPPARNKLFQSFWNWWSTFTGPHEDSFQRDIFSQERLRRARLISIMLIILVMVIALLIPSANSSPSIWLPIFILSTGGIIIALLNRLRFTTLSSIIFVLLVDVALTGFFYFKPTPQLNSTNMTAFDLFVVPILVGGVILPKALIPLTGILQIFLIFLIFFLRPHDPSLVALIQFAGGPYVALLATLVLQVTGTGLAWLHAWSVERALIRASYAEELAEARAESSRQQTLLIAQQKQRLEEGITSILEIHRQVAAGNMSARAPVYKHHELWQIGIALNILLMRMQQQTRMYRLLQITYQEFEQLAIRLEATPTGAYLALPRFNTPLVQRLLLILTR